MRLPRGLYRFLWGVGCLIIAIGSYNCKEESIPGATISFTHAYVTNRGNQTVSVIDLNVFKNVKTISVGKSPDRIVASPTSDLLLVADLDSSWVSVIDSRDQVVEKNLNVGKNPTDIVFSRRAFCICCLLQLKPGLSY
jgi:YVTN family beta-propeller protein